MAEQSKPTATKGGGAKSGLTARTIVSGLLLLPVLAVLMPSCIVLGIGMAPTGVRLLQLLAGRDRLGIIASRRFGGAVVRTRAKRRLREAFRRE